MAFLSRMAGAETTAQDKPQDATVTSRRLSLLDVGVLLVLLLIFALFLMGLNRIVFPQGARLADLGPVATDISSASNERGQVDVDGGTTGGFARFIARLADVRREVKVRSAESIAWTDAAVGIAVHNRDALQTFANSRARVEFTTDNELRIGQNSLVIFRSGAADVFLGRRDPAVVVLEGELNGRVNADYGSFVAELPAGLVRLSADGDSADPADFKLSVNPDNSSTIAIYSGQADISINGQRYHITANKALTISEDGRTSGIRDLPSAPIIRGPDAGSIAWFREMPPRVNFRWQGVDDVPRYRLEIAADERFEEILVDEYFDNTSFTHGNLPAGDYFWRVSARSGWLQGPASQARRLRIAQDIEAPPLEVEPIREAVAGGYELRGKTSRDARVYVRGQVVETSLNGSFQYLFDADPGAQLIVVEAIDQVGNVAYTTQIFHANTAFRRSD